MPLIEVNAGGSGLTGMARLSRALRSLPADSVVTIMTHGLRFDPNDPAHSPHDHILSFTPKRCWKAVSWPRHLHLDRSATSLGIAFGWPARGPIPSVAAQAFEAGAALTRLVQEVRHQRPNAKINLVAHSLGARVALAALTALPPGSVARVILMSGAEYRSTARHAFLHARPGGTQVLNVCSGENTVFDALFRLTVPPPKLADRALSAGMPDLAGWVDLRADQPSHRAVLASFGIKTRAPVTRICHWSTYLRPGLFALYRRVLDPVRPHFLTDLAADLSAAEPKRISAYPTAFRGTHLQNG